MAKESYECRMLLSRWEELSRGERAARGAPVGAYFLRRLTTTSAAMPRIMPAMIDSKGKPGTGGNVKGTDTELDVDVLAGCVVIVGVVDTVNVTTAVLTVVGVDVALADVTGVEDVVVTLLTLLTLEVLDVALEVVVTTDVLVTTLVDVEAVVVAPPPPPPVGGLSGSR